MEINERPSKTLYYLGVAEAVSRRSTCLKCRVGAVIVKDDVIISTGFNGAPRGKPNCCDIGVCERVKQNMPHGVGYDLCKSVHAEQNAIIAASREDMLNSTLYIYSWDLQKNCVVEQPGACRMCRRMIINAGIEQVVFSDPNGLDAPYPRTPRTYGYQVANVQDWVNDDEDDPISI